MTNAKSEDALNRKTWKVAAKQAELLENVRMRIWQLDSLNEDTVVTVAKSEVDLNRKTLKLAAKQAELHENVRTRICSQFNRGHGNDIRQIVDALNRETWKVAAKQAELHEETVQLPFIYYNLLILD